MNWPEVTLAEVCSKPQYGANAKGSAAPVGPRFVRQTDIVSGRIDWLSVPFCDVEESDFDKYAIWPGDLLISRLGAGVGTAAIVKEARNAVFAGYLVRFQADKNRAAPEYLGYQLSSPQWRNHVEGFRSGAAQPTLNAQQMGAFRFRLPSLAEQRRISAILGAIDEKIDSNQTQLGLLDRLFQLRWTQVSSCARGRARLSDLVSTQYGLTASAEAEPVGPKFLRVTDINKQNWLAWDAIPTAQVDSAALEKYRLNKGDLVVARMADPGKSAIYDDESVEAVFASYLVRLKARSWVESLYIYGFLKSSNYADYAAGAMTGSVQKNMNAKVIVDVEMPLPDSGQLRTFGSLAEPIRLAISQRVAENSRLTQLREALLPELLSGRIQPSEAEEAVSEAGA